VLLVGGAAAPRSRGWAWIRGAVTFLMVVTGIVYAALLANEEVGLTAAWVDAVLHQVIPAVLLADWPCFPPWYPHHPGGYGRVAAFCVVLAVVMALLALGIAAFGRWRASR
jgi:hypothetical protein